MSVRCKFKCMSVTRTWDGFTVIVLAPVYPGSGGDHAENAIFWRFTPGGEMTLRFKGDAPVVTDQAYRPNALYYIDLDDADPAPTLPWKVTQYTQREGQETIHLFLSWRDGAVAGDPYTGDLRFDNVNAGIADWTPGRPWAVRVTFAEDAAA